MNDKVRRTLPLAAATALTASALLAGAGGVLAGKPLPTADPHEGVCTPYGGQTRYTVDFDLSANKGKWAFVRGGLTVNNVEHPARFADFTQWDMDANLALETSLPGSPQAAMMTLYFGDRQGTELTSISQPLCG